MRAECAIIVTLLQAHFVRLFPCSDSFLIFRLNWRSPDCAVAPSGTASKSTAALQRQCQRNTPRIKPQGLTLSLSHWSRRRGLASRTKAELTFSERHCLLRFLLFSSALPLCCVVTPKCGLRVTSSCGACRCPRSCYCGALRFVIAPAQPTPNTS